MKKLEDIKQDMGQIWYENTESKARVTYDNSDYKDLSRVEYIDMFIQHAYAEVKEANQRLHPK